MTEVSIGMKRVRALRLADEIIAGTQDDGRLEVTLYCQGNGPDGEEVTVTISNEDMERPEVAAETIYVEIEPD